MKTIIIVTIKKTGELLAFSTVPKFASLYNLNSQTILNAMCRNKDKGTFENEDYKLQRLTVQR